MKRAMDTGLDSPPIALFTRNGSSGRWKLRKGVEVALTLDGLYYVGRAIVENVVSRDPFLLSVRVIDAAKNIAMCIPFPEDDLKELQQCEGRTIIWEERYVRPYIDMNYNAARVGRQPTQEPEDKKSIDEFLSLNVDMEVALLHGDGPNMLRAGIGKIVECSPKGRWESYEIPHSFFVVIKLEKVNSDFMDHAAYCEIPQFTVLKSCVGYRILWSGYKVRPLHLATCSHSIGQQPTLSTFNDRNLQCEHKKLNGIANGNHIASSSSSNDVPIKDVQGESRDNFSYASDEDDRADRIYCSEDDSGDFNVDFVDINDDNGVSTGVDRPHSRGGEGSIDNVQRGAAVLPSANAFDNSQHNSQRRPSSQPWPDRPLWRNRYCELLNDDLSVFGRAMIQVCLPEEACDDDVLGDTDVGVMLVSEHETLQMTTMRWKLTHTRLEGGRLLSEIVTLCSEAALLQDSDDGIVPGVRKNAYRYVRRRVLPKDHINASRMKKKTSEADVRKVSSQKCCKERCCQQFPWEATMNLRHKYYGSTFEAKRETAYNVQSQLHSGSRPGKKYITLANREVCERAWYIIHGVPRSTYYVYKAAAREGCISGLHGNSGTTRPRPQTIQARATLTTIISENADKMPNRFKVIGHKRVDNLKVVPSAMNWDHMREEVNYVNEKCKLQPVSQPAISRLRKSDFKNVEVKAVGSNFSKCTECDFLVEFIAKYPRGCDEWRSLVDDRNRHLNYQKACRNIYGGWSAQSIQNPSEFLCIIHDKMDTTKTAIPRMQRITKATVGLGQIPISCTGMLTHGHGDGAYAHYATSLWPGDSNFTISSLCRVLRALERQPVRESRVLFPTPPQNSFFEALLHGKSRCSSSIPEAIEDRTPVPSPGRPMVPLPRKLYLQLDNSAKDNKNRFLMAFCSLLTARQIFKEVTVGFLIVGHTHEDIDAHFSYFSKLIKRKNIYVLADLMKAFMDSQRTVAFIPEFVQEVADFKSYVKDFHHDGVNKVIGLGDKHIFKFYVEDSGADRGWPVMRYKKRATDSSWLPPGRAVKMWRADAEGNPKIPSGVPKPVPMNALWGNVEVNARKVNIQFDKEVARASECLERQSFIRNGIAKFIEHWKCGMGRNRRYADEMSGIVAYWTRILAEIYSPLPSTPLELQEGFWPISNWKRDHVPIFANEGPDPHDTVDITPEDDAEPYPYCGPAKDRPKLSFNPYRDVLLGDFVLCRPFEGSYLPVWLGRVLECVDLKEGPTYGNFKVEWWIPMRTKKESKSTIARECWTRRWQKEKCLPQIVHVSIVLFSHRMPSHAKTGPPATHIIPDASVTAALENLEAAGAMVDLHVDDGGDD